MKLSSKILFTSVSVLLMDRGITAMLCLYGLLLSKSHNTRRLKPRPHWSLIVVTGNGDNLSPVWTRLNRGFKAE